MASQKKLSKSGKVIHLKSRSSFNIGLLIFLIIFIYLLIFVVRYITSDTVKIYEVQTGSMSTTSTYTGLILRSEEVYTASESGYLNYYVKDGGRVSVGSLIYTIDETASMTELLKEMEHSEDALSLNTVNSIKNYLSSFSRSYKPSSFSDIYTLSENISQSLGTGISESALESLILQAGENNLNFTMYDSEDAGIITYRTDGLENLSSSDLTDDIVKGKNYSQTVYSPGDLVEASSSVCKVINSDEWDIVIPISSKDISALGDETVVSITFNDTNITVNAEYSSLVSSDGNIYANLHLYKYMIRYCDQRYVDITLNINKASGLKIPISSVITRELFVIPTEYLLTVTSADEDENTNTAECFRVQTYDDKGNISTTDIKASIYLEQDGMYYVGTDAFEAGDVLQNEDASSTYTVYATGSVQGVYNVNRGYAVFCIVDILDENDEYYIISDSTNSGISVYDHIILNASLAYEDEILFN